MDMKCDFTSSFFSCQVNCSNLVSWVLAHVEVNISVLECEEPEVQVVQAPRLAIWRSQSTLVEASVDLKGCQRYGAQYLWQILSAPSCDNDPDNHVPSGVMTQTPQSSPVIRLPVEVDVQRLQLSLPKMVLPAGNYTLVFSLSYENVPLRKAACLQLSVMAARSAKNHRTLSLLFIQCFLIFLINSATTVKALIQPKLFPVLINLSGVSTQHIPSSFKTKND